MDKRLVRSPKIYLRDSGLLHALLEIGDLHQLQGHVAIGPSWEGFVVESLISTAGQRARPYFYRTHDGAEIDLLFEHGGKPMVAVEIKRSSAPTIEQGFYYACDELRVRHRIVVAPVESPYPMKGGVMVQGVVAAMSAITALLNT